MLEYAKLVLSRASHGFALRIDLWYAAAGVILAGLTGSREQPLGALTPFELARYLLVAVTAWWLFRLLLLGPYRIWQEQRAQIGTLMLETQRPERVGADELHRLRAGKRLDLAAEISRLQWLCFNGKSDDDIAGDGAWYDRVTRLASEVNPPPVFFRILGEQHEICFWLETTPVARRNKSLRA